MLKCPLALILQSMINCLAQAIKIILRPQFTKLPTQSLRRNVSESKNTLLLNLLLWCQLNLLKRIKLHKTLLNIASVTSFVFCAIHLWNSFANLSAFVEMHLTRVAVNAITIIFKVLVICNKIRYRWKYQ